MTEDTDTRTEVPITGTGTGQELFLGLLWLATSMWTAHATITGSGDDLSGALGQAAAALPGVVAATLLTGATIGSAAASRYRSAGRRLLVGLAVGAAFGVVAAAAIRFGYGTTPSIMVLAVTVGVASLVGGAAAALPGGVLDAALWATSWVFFAGVIFGVLQPQLTKLLGGGPTADAAAQATADTRFTLAQSVLTGVIAGYFALQKLRNERPGRGWSLLAGALPGLVLLAAEGLMRVGGSTLVHFVHGFAPDEPALVQLNDAARLRHGLIVLVAGGILAAIAVGRRTEED